MFFGVSVYVRFVFRVKNPEKLLRQYYNSSDKNVFKFYRFHTKMTRKCKATIVASKASIFFGSVAMAVKRQTTKV